MTSTERLMQPHEGVAGVERLGDALLVNPQACDWVLSLTRQLYSASLSNTPHSRTLFERLTNPTVGQAVVVSDAARHLGVEQQAEHRFHAVGYLVAHRREWWTTDEQWAADLAEEGSGLEPGDRAIEPAAWYVQYGPDPDMVCRWVNCQVLAVPALGSYW